MNSKIVSFANIPNSIYSLFVRLSAEAINHSKMQSFILSEEELRLIYNLAVSHQMTAIIADALESAGIIDERFVQSKKRIIILDKLIDKERKRILDEMSRQQIWHMPLKGAVLKNYYPQPWMRQMADNDILFDSSRAADVRRIMKSFGYSVIHEGEGHQDDYQKKPCYHFEMHRMLFSSASEKNIYNYYQNIYERLQGVNMEKSFSPEDYYVYMVAHEYKHYYWTGTGLRSLLDTYVYLKNFKQKLDWPYILSEVRRIGIEEFEERNRKLAYKVFAESNLNELTEEESEMLSFFLSSGMYGTKEHEIMNSIRRHGRVRFMLHKLFPPMSEVKLYYPFFNKYWLLIPFLPIYRLYKRKKNVYTTLKLLFRL